MLKKFFIIFFVSFFFTCPANAEGLFENNSVPNAPTIMIGETACYGDHELQPIFFETFREEMENALRNTKEFNVKIFTLSSLDTDIENNSDSQILSFIHMDCIAYAPLYRREAASASMVRYADEIFGRDYFWNDEKMAVRRARAGKPYRISEKATDAIKNIGEKYQVDYILFCNLRDVDTQLKHANIFKASTEKLGSDYRPKKLKAELEYYLIDTHKGLVFEGHDLTNKTGQILQIFAKFGTGATVENLLHSIFEVQTKKVAKDVSGTAKKVLEKSS